jgi:very-short-patch-repair endonuclease
MINRNETVILAIIEKYCKTKKLKFEPQYSLGGLMYDCCVDGSVLIEFDELHHSAKRQQKIDADKDSTAAGNNFTLHRFSVEHDIVDIILVLESIAGETAKLRHIAEAYLSEHQETKNFLSGFGKKRICDCSNCKIAREVLAKSGIEPENLPPEEDIKKLERRVKAHDKKLVNGTQKLKSFDGGEEH